MNYSEVKKMQEEMKEKGVKLNRKQLRSLMKEGKHKPVYTKK